MTFFSYQMRNLMGVLFICFLLVIVEGCSASKAAPDPAPNIVEVATVVQQDTPIYSEWVAVLDGYVNAQIQPHVSGYIIKQNYKEGRSSARGTSSLRSTLVPSRHRSTKRRPNWPRLRRNLARPVSMSSEIHLSHKRGQFAQSQLDTEIRRSSVHRPWCRRQRRMSSRLNSTSNGPESRLWSAGSPAAHKSRLEISLDPVRSHFCVASGTRSRRISRE